ncbi:2994_t:CDS:10, partial [Diversispora eburnea]
MAATEDFINKLSPNFLISPDKTYATLNVPIEKSENDDREYRLIKLANELEILLIHDPNTDKSSAAMDVKIGQIHDPPNLQGLSHFCEHLLFMGSEKYPKDNEYTELVMNIWKDPWTDKELNAVDSDDNWKKYQLERSLSNQNHPFSQFGIGNIESLKEIPLKAGLDVREELIKHHKKYYSANLMKLVVLGREPLDQLNNWVVEQFSGVKNKSIPNLISIKPVKNAHNLEITFPFPDQTPLYETKPSRYISHLIGHEGEGSILSLLKKKVLIQFTKVLISQCTKFRLILPTKVKTIASIDFRFLEKGSPSGYTSGLSAYMQYPYPRELILSTPHLIRKYDAKLITEGLNFLNWNTCILTLSSKLLSGFNKKEKWFDTEYKFEPINPKFLQELQDLTLNPELKITGPNEFIPSNFEVKKIENVKPLERPFLIKDTKLSRLWYKKDDRFWVPKVEAHFLLNTPLANVTPLHSVMTGLYIDLVIDAFSDFAYDAGMAGLTYYLYDQGNGIGVSVTGYNDKAILFLDKIIQKMKNFIIGPERFLKIKEELKRTLQNRLLDSPYELAMCNTSYIINQKIWSFQERLDVLDEINYQDVQEFYPKLFKQMFFEGLVHGNIDKLEAINMIEIIENILESKELSSSQLIDNRSLLLKEGKYAYFKEVKDEKEINSAIDYYIQIGDIMDKNLRAKLSLIGQIADEPCYNQLRTQEQLDRVTGSMGFRIIIQSEKDTIYLENRIEEFFNKLQ